MRTNFKFYKALLDSLDNQIAVIGESGEILYVNKVWIDFGISNGMPTNFDWLGENYLKVCNAEGDEVNTSIEMTAKGIRRVMSGEVDVFESDYPCHTPMERRWFMMRIVCMIEPKYKLWVISHTNITDRKLAEEKIELLSITDPLTSLGNRRQLDKFLSDEWHRALRSQTSISLAIFDIDHFKAVNDIRGHAFGDECLCRVACILRQFTKRPGDLATRFGGEEFVVVLGGTGTSEALSLVNRIREAIAELGILISGEMRMTISAGVSSVIPTHHGDCGSLIKWADEALYAAKINGRNRVELAST
jgi:diguanylate cyclase (GGDEF)-like protein